MRPIDKITSRYGYPLQWFIDHWICFRCKCIAKVDKMDDKSKAEQKLSSYCQKCQDNFFTEDYKETNMDDVCTKHFRSIFPDEEFFITVTRAQKQVHFLI